MKVVLNRDAQEQFDALPPSLQVRIFGLFERLTAWPLVSGVRRLRGRLAGHWRIRTGDYRVQFRIEENRVVVVKVGHRDRFDED